MKYLLFGLIIKLTLIGHGLFGQDGIITTYYSKENKEVYSGQSYYYEMRKERMSSIDTIVSFYSKTDKLRSISIVNEFGVGNGAFSYYHENGGKKSKGTNKNGKPLGKVESYYPNGKTQSVENFFQDPWESVIDAYYESLGNQLVKSGNGYCRCFYNSYQWPELFEIGKLVNGQKDSVWTGYRNGTVLYFSERYKKGEFVSGTSFDSLGNTYKYDEINLSATPVGGMQAFYNHVAKTLKYPAEARRSGMQGKVFVEFVINEDGTLSNVKSVKGIGYGCDEEAVRAVETSLDWVPGKSRGQISKQRMVLAITFKLG